MRDTNHPPAVSKSVSQSYSLWTRRYWVFMLFGSSILYLAYDFLAGVALERSSVLQFPVLFGSVSLLLGAFCICIPAAYSHAQAFVFSSFVLVLIFEIYTWSEDSPSRLPAPFLLAFTSLFSRFAPPLFSALAVACLTLSLLFSLLIERNFPSFLALVSDQALLWMTAYLCSIGSRRSFTLQSDLIDAFLDHLKYHSSSQVSPGSLGGGGDVKCEFSYYDVKEEQAAYIRTNWSRAVFGRLSSSMEKRFRVWMKGRNAEYFSKHSLLVAAEMVLLVMIISPYDKFRKSTPVLVVQIVAISVIVASLVFASVARLLRSRGMVTRARFGFLTSVGLLLASAVFSSVYSVMNSKDFINEEAQNNGGGNARVASSGRVLPFSNTPVDAWLFTSILTFVMLDEMSWVVTSNAVILGSGVVYFKFWALNSPGVIVVYGLQFVLLFAMLLVQRVVLNNARRVLFLLTAAGGETSEEGRAKTRNVAVEGVQSHMSSMRTLYTLRVGEQSEMVVVSAEKLRERLWRLKSGKGGFVVDEFFDKLSPELSAAKERKVKARLGALLTRIGQHLDEEEFAYVFGKRKVPSMNITIQTVGSRGDVQPFLFVARELQKAGHKVVLATHEKFRKFVEDFKVGFFPLALVREDHWQPEQLMRYAESNPAMGPDLLMRPKALYHIVSNAPEMANTLRTIFLPPGGEEVTSDFGPKASVAKADALIANPPSYAHVHLAEAFGIPLHLVFTMPWTPTRTVGHPLCVSSADANAFWKELSYRWMELIQWRGVSGAVNDFRLSMGLDRHNSTDASIVDKWRVPFAYMFSQVLLPKPPDWGSNVDVTGFITDDSTSHLSFVPPENLGRFVSDHQPVYIGFGSISSDLSHIYKAILAACTLFPRTKFLIHKGWSPLNDLKPEDFPPNTFLLCPPPSASPAAPTEAGTGQSSWEERMEAGLGKDRVCLLSSIPHPWLFPRCSAVVHHGGAGTTAAGLAAGRPTVVCAFFGDQVIWGQMVERLKCGSMVLAREEEGEATEDKFRQAFEFVLSAEAQKNAKEVAEALELEKQQGAGAKAVVEAFERQMAVELVACEVCEEQKADRICGTFGLRCCANCAAAVGDFDEFPLRRADWGHSRQSGVMPGGLSRIGKAILKLKKRPIQGFEAAGVVGLVWGFMLALVELLVESIRLPYHLVMSALYIGYGEVVIPSRQKELVKGVVPENADRVRAEVLELKLVRVKMALAQEKLPEILLSENIRQIMVGE